MIELLKLFVGTLVKYLTPGFDLFKYRMENPERFSVGSNMLFVVILIIFIATFIAHYKFRNRNKILYIAIVVTSIASLLFLTYVFLVIINFH